MSSHPAVTARDVSKLFHRGERHDSLRDLIPAAVRRLRGQAAPPPELDRDAFWAVKDVSFDVEFGRALGIIGPNGAGKSTMLKLLTGILRPSTGEIRMRGRVASLIEVSAGFHQDLTGRENVYLQGAIMGMTRREVDRRLEGIVDFSGIAPFIDTPVKRYSSGMNARLGFSIAVHLDPDVLVIDEVLSVGDMAFQQKCTDRMQQFKRDGVAVIFVSHNMQAVGELCDEALVIKGNPRFRGAVGEAVGHYLAIVNGESHDRTRGDGVTLSEARLVDAGGRATDAVAPHDRMRLEFDLEFDRPLEGLGCSLVLRRTTDGMTVYDGFFPLAEMGCERVGAGESLTLAFDHRLHVARGQYAYEMSVFDTREQRDRLRVVPAAGVRVDEYRNWGGVVDLEVEGSVAERGAARAPAASAAG